MKSNTNQWWIRIVALGSLAFISYFIVIAIDSNWLNNNNWFDLERKFWSKPIWDWIGLLVAPIVLALAGFFIRQLLEQQEAARRDLLIEQEDDRRKHEALKDYLDDITALFLSDNWGRAVQEKHKHQESKSTDDKVSNQKVFAIAKARTLAALNELNKERKVQLIRFLSESRELVNFTFPGRKQDLKGVHLRGAHLEGANLADAHLELAYLDSVHLEGASLFCAHLERAYLADAHLEHAYLADAHLEHAYLADAHLEHAYLNRAHLEDANLFCANLKGANLEEAHLEDTNLWKANLESTHLKDITWNKKTKWEGVTGLDTAKNIPDALKPHLIELGVLSPETDNPESSQLSPEEE